MSPQQLLDILSDFNDGADVRGYFGWQVEGDKLIVSYTPDGSAASWRLVLEQP